MMIDLTPSREEYARIIAYLFSTHLELSPSAVVGGDYWHFTKDEEEVLFTAYGLVNRIAESLETVDFDFYQSMPKGARKRIIFDAIAKARQTVEAQA
jgi:hypothetical protein